MSTNENLENIIFGDLAGQKALRLEKAVNQMKCTIHGNNDDFDLNKMYIIIKAINHVEFKTTNKCCCEQFAKELNDKAQDILRKI